LTWPVFTYANLFQTYQPLEVQATLHTVFSFGESKKVFYSCQATGKQHNDIDPLGFTNGDIQKLAVLLPHR
jgi:hypothetical protein